MTTHFDTGVMAFGLETEIDRLAASRALSVLEQHGFKDVWVTTDASSGVSAEIVFPPLVLFLP